MVLATMRSVERQMRYHHKLKLRRTMIGILVMMLTMKFFGQQSILDQEQKLINGIIRAVYDFSIISCLSSIVVF